MKHHDHGLWSRGVFALPFCLAAVSIGGCAFGDPASTPGAGAAANGAAPGTGGGFQPPRGKGGAGGIPGAAGSSSGGSGTSETPDAGSAGRAGSAQAPDGAPPGDAAPTGCDAAFATGPSRCTVTDQRAECTHSEATIDGRLVYWQTPLGTPPPGGFPTVVVYQGSFFGPTMTWSGDPSMPFGGFNQAKLQAMLLDNGFTVIAPSANGAAWNTNFPGYELSSDARFIPLLLSEIKKGTFGPSDPRRLYATGISSGGYMTSRMAVSYPGEFRALAIESGSYATCSNVACAIPKPLPADHPPTLFLHGSLDVAVPEYTAKAYHDALSEQGIETEMIVDPAKGHAWLDLAPQAITCWFQSH